MPPALSTRRHSSLSVALLALACLALVGLARADSIYCEGAAFLDVFSDAEGRDRLDGGHCRELERVALTWSGGRSTLYLLAAPGVPDGPSVESMRAVARETARRVGDAMSTMGTVSLPPEVHVVLLAGAHPEDAGRPEHTHYAESFDLALFGDDCPVVFYDSAGLDIAGAGRRLAHELFHCIQRETWADKVQGGAGWWMEGTAKWFEYLAFPAASPPPNLAQTIEVFHRRSLDLSLVEMNYAPAVFFAWLAQHGPARVPAYVANLASRGEPQLPGAARALAPSEYQRFAEDYLDDRIVFPGGARVVGPKYQEPWVTTGDPDNDPDLVETPAPLKLFRKRLRFVPGGYRPAVEFGGQTVRFSQDDGPWGNLPASLLVQCDREQTFRAVAMTPADPTPALRIDPGTDQEMVCRDCGAAGSNVRRARCAIGTWRLDPSTWTGCAWASAHLGGMLGGRGSAAVECSMAGEMTATFEADGSMRGEMSNLRNTASIDLGTGRGPSIRMSVTTEIASAASTGQWATREGALDLCNAVTAGTGTTTFSGQGFRRSAPLTFPGPASFEFGYSCEGDRMQLRVAAAGMGSGFSFEMQRVSPRR